MKDAKIETTHKDVKHLRNSIFDYHEIESLQHEIDEAASKLNSVLHRHGMFILSDDMKARIKAAHKTVDDLHHDLYETLHEFRGCADKKYNEIVKDNGAKHE